LEQQRRKAEEYRIRIASTTPACTLPTTSPTPLTSSTFASPPVTIPNVQLQAPESMARESIREKSQTTTAPAKQSSIGILR